MGWRGGSFPHFRSSCLPSVRPKPPPLCVVIRVRANNPHVFAVIILALSSAHHTPQSKFQITILLLKHPITSIQECSQLILQFKTAHPKQLLSPSEHLGLTNTTSTNLLPPSGKWRPAGIYANPLMSLPIMD